MWLFQANKSTLEQKLMTLTTTILPLQQTKIILSQCDAHDRTAPIKTNLNKNRFKLFFRGLPQKVAAYQRTAQTGAVSDSNITVSRKRLIIYFCNNHTILSILTIMTILTIQTPF